MLSSQKNKRAGANTQDITARGSALYRLIAIAALVILLPTLLVFGYLLALRDPALQNRQLDQVADAFALRGASTVHQMVAQLRTRITGAAQSPLALQSIASRSATDIRLVEKTMLDYFPEVVSLRILPIGEMGTANFEGGNPGLRNHIELDLVRRASEGEQTLPESYQFEGRWLTSLSQVVSHPREAERNAVIIATLDNKLLSERLQSLDTQTGQFALQQIYTDASGKAQANTIAASGSAATGAPTRIAKLPDTTWQVAFTPSPQLLETLAFDPLPGYLSLAACLLAALAGLGVIAIGFPRILGVEVDRVIADADTKLPLALAVPELVSIAKQLRRATNLNAARASTNGDGGLELELNAGVTDELTNPMFQSTSMIDEEEEVLELDLDADTDPPAPKTPSEPGFPDHIFRAYDIRGHAQNELDDAMVTRLGGAIGTIALDQGEQTLIVACDGRSSSPRIKNTLIRALLATGRDVIDLGMVPTPLLYFATRHLDFGSGVMITGSHNPAPDNGMKIVLNQQTIAAGGIQQIRELVLTGGYSQGSGKVVKTDIVPAYIDEVVSDIAIAAPLKVVIDAGNGATSNIAPQLFTDLGCEVVPLYCEVDGSFPNHDPDTSNEDNLADLVAAVQREGADFGVAFDGDGDRLAVVGSSGRIVRSDVLMMIYAQDVVSRNPGADVVFDVKCSRNLAQLITRHGGRPVLWKTGHAFMKEKMAETGALLGGEFSGHMFFGERWFGFDDGMYAAGRLAEILSTHGESLDDAVATFPVTVNTPEILIPVAEDQKFAVMARIIREADFTDGKINTLDGIRVDYPDGWGLLRASNTTAALTARFEADTEQGLAVIQQQFKSQIMTIAPDLTVSF